MAITKITIYCATETMGDNVTEKDADGYRDWLSAEIGREFPGADVTVLDEQATNTVRTDADADDYADEERLQYFVQAAWDRCGWEWVNADAGFSLGDRVEAGEGEDHDTGTIERIDGGTAFVSWDSGVKTPASVRHLSAI